MQIVQILGLKFEFHVLLYTRNLKYGCGTEHTRERGTRSRMGRKPVYIDNGICRALGERATTRNR